jgi:orotidine-5'-phosphate decarboxylase
LSEVGVQADAGSQVERLAALAVQAGLRGLVCSPREIAGLRKLIPREIQLAVPGIRDGTSPPDDQKRTMAAAEAMAAGADWLVIGRPICAAKSPRGAAEQILAAIAAGAR